MRTLTVRALEALLSTKGGAIAVNVLLLIVFPLSWVALYWRDRARDALRG